MGSPFTIVVDASPAARAAIERLERAEDVRFSPNNRRLAIADFDRDLVAIADIEITVTDGQSPRVAMTAVTEFWSRHLHDPHGVAFLDDDTIVVASREGTMTVHDVPNIDAAPGPIELSLVELAPSEGFGRLQGPSALSVARDDAGHAEVMVCNFYGDVVTRHVLDRNGSERHEVLRNDVLVRDHLGRPDGVAISPDGAWIALSILDPPRVLMYEREALRNGESDPQAILLGLWHPHGLRFSADSRSLLVADAAMPSVHIFARNGATWHGLHHQPSDSVAVFDDEVFDCGLGFARCGPKGLDIDPSGRVLAVTGECQSITLFDLSAILDRSAGRGADHARSMRYELSRMREERAIEARHHARLASIMGSRSYRLTKPLRSLNEAAKRRRSA
jgi:hypothetical protein